MDAVGIANVALGLLGANGITSFEDDSTEAELCLSVYDSVRDAVLEAGDWSFASEWVVAAKLAAAPTAPRHAAAYTVPTRAASVREVTDADGRAVAWVKGSGQVLCEDALPSVRLRIVSKEAAPERYSPGFVQALATKLAARLAVPLTENGERQASLEAEYLVELRKAKVADGKQGTPQRRTSSWLRNARS
jgi:hypothetical protein